MNKDAGTCGLAPCSRWEQVAVARNRPLGVNLNASQYHKRERGEGGQRTGADSRAGPSLAALSRKHRWARTPALTEPGRKGHPVVEEPQVPPHAQETVPVALAP